MIELLVVIAIIGFLASIVVVSLADQRIKETKIKTTCGYEPNSKERSSIFTINVLYHLLVFTDFLQVLRSC